MASGFYNSGRQLFIRGQLDWNTADIRAVLVNISGGGTMYTFNATHTTMNNVVAGWAGGASGAVIAAPVALGSKTSADGIADAADTPFTGVTGDSVEAVILYVHNATPANGQLLAYIDGISVTPNGGDITIIWDNGANKIFKL